MPRRPPVPPSWGPWGPKGPKKAPGGLMGPLGPPWAPAALRDLREAHCTLIFECLAKILTASWNNVAISYGGDRHDCEVQRRYIDLAFRSSAQG